MSYVKKEIEHLKKCLWEYVSLIKKARDNE